MVSPTHRCSVLPSRHERIAPQHEDVAQEDVGKLTVVELFAGAGGMALGLHRAGFAALRAIDFDRWAVESLRTNGTQHLGWTPQTAQQGDLSTLRVEDWQEFRRIHGEIDLLAGGPPCQPFSSAGKNAGRWDPRDGFPWFLTAIEGIRPRALLIENVKGLTTKKHADYFARVLHSLRELNYAIEWRVYNAASFGVPQQRHRVFIVGMRGDLAQKWSRFQWPMATHSEERLVYEKWVDGSYWRGIETPEGFGIRTEMVGAVTRPLYESSPTVPHSGNQYPAPLGSRRVEGKRLGDGELVGVASRRTRDGEPRDEVRPADEPSTALMGNHGEGARLRAVFTDAPVTMSRDGNARIEYPLANPSANRGPSDLVRRHPASVDDQPGVAQTRNTPPFGFSPSMPVPSRREQRILKKIEGGDTTGLSLLRWHTVRDAIADLAGLVSNRMVSGANEQMEKTGERPPHTIEEASPSLRGDGGRNTPLIESTPPNHDPAPLSPRYQERIAAAPGGAGGAENIVKIEGTVVPKHRADEPSLTVSAGGTATGGAEPIAHNRLAIRNQAAGAGNGAGLDDASVTVVIERGTSFYDIEKQRSYQDAQGRTHKRADGYLRRLTPREAARLMGTPDWWFYCGPKTAQYRQVGNGCCPAVAEVIARQIACALDESLKPFDGDTHGTQNASNTPSVLHDMQGKVGAKATQKQTGTLRGTFPLHAPEVLQPTVHGGELHRSIQEERQTENRERPREETLPQDLSVRTVRKRESRTSPPGSKSTQQHPNEHPVALPVLPPNGTPQDRILRGEDVSEDRDGDRSKGTKNLRRARAVSAPLHASPSLGKPASMQDQPVHTDDQASRSAETRSSALTFNLPMPPFR